MRNRWVALLLVVPLLAAGPVAAGPRPPVVADRTAPAGPAGVVSSSTGCVSDWYVSYFGQTSWVLVHSDPEGLPLSDLRFDRGYNDPTDSSKGYLDFNHDGRSDVFSAVPMDGGDYRWRYVSPGPGTASTNWSDWTDLAFADTPPDQLRFGDFNGDGYTDVFSTLDQGGGLLQWRVSFSGTDSFQNLAAATTPLDQLRFGDFNADGKTDVFTLQDLSGGELGWEVSYSGTASYQQIFSYTQPLSAMAFGDLNYDGHTDVFTTLPAGGVNYDWYYSSAGSNSFQYIATRPRGVHNVLLAGNFDPLPSTPDGYGGTDFFYTTLRLDGAYQWMYSHINKNNTGFDDMQLAYDTTPPDQLRFGDFNGDGVTDVFKLQQRCALHLPLVTK